MFHWMDYRYADGVRQQNVLNGILLTIGGGLVILTGLWGSSQRSPLCAALLAWLAPIGLLITLAGIMLMLIPNFFA